MVKSDLPADVVVIGDGSLFADGMVSVIRSLGYRVTAVSSVAEAGSVPVVVLLSPDQVPGSGCVHDRTVIAMFPESAMLTEVDGATCRGVDVYVGPSMSRKEFAEILVARVPRRARVRKTLSTGERRVLSRYVDGSTRKSLATDLYLSPGTVSTHLQRIRDKYRAAGRPAGTKVEMLMRGIEDGIVDCPCRRRPVDED